MKPKARPDVPSGTPGPDRAVSPRRTLLLLAMATAIGSTGLAAGGTAGALLGAEMTGTGAAAGLPLGVLVLGSAAAAILVSRRAGSVGRGRSLALGYVLGLSGAAVVVVAAVAGSFAALLLGSAALGAGNVAVFMARYAAAEIGGEAARGRALGAVFFAAALGSVFAPSLLGPSGEAAAAVGLPPLTGLYLVTVPCFAIAALLLAAASSPRVPFLGVGSSLLGPGERATATRPEVASGLKAPAARTGLLVLAAVNLVMVAVMAIAPVHMVAHGHDLGLVGIVVGAHVAGMFVPSPVSGWVVDRAGPAAAVAAGLFFLVAAGLAGAVLDTGGAPSMIAALLMLGARGGLELRRGGRERPARRLRSGEAAPARGGARRGLHGSCGGSGRADRRPNRRTRRFRGPFAGRGGRGSRSGAGAHVCGPDRPASLMPAGLLVGWPLRPRGRCSSSRNRDG